MAIKPSPVSSACINTFADLLSLYSLESAWRWSAFLF